MHTVRLISMGTARFRRPIGFKCSRDDVEDLVFLNVRCVGDARAYHFKHGQMDEADAKRLKALEREWSAAT